MTKLEAAITKVVAVVKVVVTAAPTYLAAAALAIPEIAHQIGTIFPGAAERITADGLTTVGVIGAVLAVIARVTPVLKAERGILPKAP